MKKISLMLAAFAVVLVGCSSSEAYYEGSYTTEDGDVVDVSYSKTGDDITNTQFTVTTVDGENKEDLVAAGEYDLGSDLTWTEQVQSLEATIDENDAFPTLDAEGYDVDGVSSATINLTDFEMAFNGAAESDGSESIEETEETEETDM